jgi:hypothetical protein
MSYAKSCGLFSVRIPWYHPRQTWYLFSNNKDRLPNKAMMKHLSGAVFFNLEFSDSWKTRQRVSRKIKTHIQQILPLPIKNFLKAIA